MLADYLNSIGKSALAIETNKVELFGPSIDPASWLFIKCSDGWFSIVENKDGTALCHPHLVKMKECRFVIKNQYAPGTYGEFEPKVKAGMYAEQLPLLYHKHLDKNRQIAKTEALPFFKGILRYGGRREILQRLGMSLERGWGPEEYYARMAAHRVGLALPGCGNICHREIEYVGVGTVPLMVPHVSVMRHPLIAGKHFIAAKPGTNVDERARNLKIALDHTPPDQLRAMSAACIQWFDAYVRYPACCRILAEDLGCLS